MSQNLGRNSSAPVPFEALPSEGPEYVTAPVEHEHAEENEPKKVSDLLQAFEVEEENALLGPEESAAQISILRRRLFGEKNADVEMGELQVSMMDDGEKLSYDDFHSKTDEILEKTSWDHVQMDFQGSLSTLVAAIIGVGVVQLPLMLHHAGFVLGSTIFLFVGYMSHIAGVYYGLACRLTGETVISRVADKALGKFGLFLSIFAMIGLCWGALTAYVVTWYDLLAPILETFGLFSQEALSAGTETMSLFSVRSLVLVVCLAGTMPLNLMKSLDKLAFASNFSAASFVVLTLIVVFMYLKGFVFLSEEELKFGDGKDQWTLRDDMPDADKYKVMNHPCHGLFDYKSHFLYNTNFVFAFSMVSTAFACHFSCIPVFASEMKMPTRSRITRSMAYSSLICLAMYGAFMFCGWQYSLSTQRYEATSQKCVQGPQASILANFPSNDMLPNFARLLIFSVLFLTFPLLCNATRSSVHSNIFPNLPIEEASNMLFLVETVAVCGGAVAIAILVPQIGCVLGYVGCLPGSVLVYILPGCLMLKLVQNATDTENAEANGRSLKADKIGAILLIVVGVGMMIVGTITNAIAAEQLANGANISLKNVSDEVSYFELSAENSYVETKMSAIEKALKYAAAASASDIVSGDVVSANEQQ